MKEIFRKGYTGEKIEVKVWDVKHLIKKSFCDLVKYQKKGYTNLVKTECTVLSGRLQALMMLDILTWDEYLKYHKLLTLWMRKNHIR